MGGGRGRGKASAGQTTSPDRMNPGESLPAVLGLGLGGLLVIALGLHTWGLGWFNSLVFDEVYYVPFALKYLNGESFFDAHPPLGKYLLALSIALGQRLTVWLNWPTFWLGDQTISALSFRWLNALAGATLPLGGALLGFYLSRLYSLDRRLTFALLGGGLILVSGLPLVESRFALINIYWVWFGVLGQLCWVLAQGHPWGNAINQSSPQGRRSVCWQIAAGVFLGAAVAVKWNGAGFWLGIVLLEVPLGWGWGSRQAKSPILWRALLGYLGLIPLLTYSLLWIPHLWMNQVSWLEVHRQLWTAHQSIGNAVAPHPYCSAWYTWPLMLRPVAYFYAYGVDNPPASILGPPPAAGPITYTVQGMGNPLLWWLATAAVIALGTGWISRGTRKLRGLGSKGSWGRMVGPARPSRGDSRAGGKNIGTKGDLSGTDGGHGMSPVVSFLLVNYGANWLPWMVVGRCTFLYHALGMVVFSCLALAWLLSRWLLDHRWHYRVMAWIMVVVLLWGFWFWLPVFLGLPLSPEALQQRWWLPSWI